MCSKPAALLALVVAGADHSLLAPVTRAGELVWQQRRHRLLAGLLLCAARGVGAQPGAPLRQRLSGGSLLALSPLCGTRCGTLCGDAALLLHTSAGLLCTMLRHVTVALGAVQVPNAAALALIQRFMHNQREFDGTPTRDRLKLIPRIVNVAEWAEKGPLSGERGRGRCRVTAAVCLFRGCTISGSGL